MKRLTILLSWLFAASPLAAIPLVVRAPSSMTNYVRQVQTVDPASFGPLLELTGNREPQPPIEVVIEPERSEVAASAPPWISGWAIGEASLVIMIPSRAGRYPDNGVDELLRHELAHVLEWRSARGRTIPRWFNEGLAMFASRGWQLEDRSRFAFEMLRGDQVPIRDLDRLFAADEREVGRAYAISGAFVRDLVLQRGRQVPGQILQRIGEGASFDEAFSRVCNQSFEEAEAGFWRRQTIWNRWVPFLTSTTALWILITVLALWAIGKQRARRRARELASEESLLADWEDEDSPPN